MIVAVPFFKLELLSPVIPTEQLVTPRIQTTPGADSGRTK
jgi:hypothetical protein